MIVIPAGFGDVPVDPDAPEAREWLLEELGKDAYAGSSFLDDVVRWLQRIFDQIGGNGGGEGSGAVGFLVVVLVIAAIITVAFLVFGLPRLRRRSRVTGELFGEEDDRDAAGIRSAAERAAAAGDYTTAVVEAFRALARRLAERGIVETFPGTTARDFAVRAGVPFPLAADRLRDAARIFDDVRYLGRAGTEDQWRHVAGLERDLRTARPISPTGAAREVR